MFLRLCHYLSLRMACVLLSLGYSESVSPLFMGIPPRTSIILSMLNIFNYSCLFIKTWALYKVWRSAEKFQKTNLTPAYILRLIGAYMLVEIVILVVWSIVDRPKAEYHSIFKIFVNNYFCWNYRSIPSYLSPPPCLFVFWLKIEMVDDSYQLMCKTKSSTFWIIFVAVKVEISLLFFPSPPPPSRYSRFLIYIFREHG